jgi:archaellum component FlaC
MEETDYLMDKKIEYLIDMKVGKLKNELGEALKKINEMNEEMNTLKNNIQRLNMGVSPQTKLVQKEQSQVQQPTIQQSTVQSQEKPKEVNQRTGGLTPKDVSVEKFFYYGNK